MKKMKLFLALLVFGMQFTFAQTPNALPYQAVARNSSGNLLVNQAVRLRFSIHDVTATGTIVYRENQTATTSPLGLFSISIGQGTATTGTFASINWGSGLKFTQVEIDVTGGTSYVDMGTQQMMSVPYALYAANANVPGVAGPQGAVGPQGPQGPTGLTGAIGLQGPIGLTGAIGPQGSIGLTGNSGPQGLTGLPGATGLQGPIGLTGATGAQGPAGNDGAQGPQGEQGIPGLQGPEGPAGATGAAGINGLNGALGATGASGTNGLNAYEVWLGLGNTGTEANFIASLTGPQGPAGLRGLTGATGPQGLQGPAGPAGTSMASLAQRPPAPPVIYGSACASTAVGSGSYFTIDPEPGATSYVWKWYQSSNASLTYVGTGTSSSFINLGSGDYISVVAVNSYGQSGETKLYANQTHGSLKFTAATNETSSRVFFTGCLPTSGVTITIAGASGGANSRGQSGNTGDIVTLNNVSLPSATSIYCFVGLQGEDGTPSSGGAGGKGGIVNYSQFSSTFCYSSSGGDGAGDGSTYGKCGGGGGGASIILPGSTSSSGSGFGYQGSGGYDPLVIAAGGGGGGRSCFLGDPTTGSGCYHNAICGTGYSTLSDGSVGTGGNPGYGLTYSQSSCAGHGGGGDGVIANYTYASTTTTLGTSGGGAGRLGGGSGNADYDGGGKGLSYYRLGLIPLNYNTPISGQNQGDGYIIISW